MAVFILLSMIFLHIIDDYVLQGMGKLNVMKQKNEWDNEIRDGLYKNDYMVALAVHSFSWAFMIMLPIAILGGLNIGLGFLIAFVLNMFLHGFVDDLKANRFKINLIVDQSIHMAQILITWFVFVILT